MQRVQTQDQAEMVRIALGCFPPVVRELLSGVNWFFGDPLFAGLHRHTQPAGTYPDGVPYSYAECKHYVQVHNQLHLAASRRVPTIVVPYGVYLSTKGFCHELGHALDERLCMPSESLCVPPITRYAATNPGESFAEAVAALVGHDPRYFDWSWHEFLRQHAQPFLAFFQKLAD